MSIPTQTKKLKKHQALIIVFSRPAAVILFRLGSMEELLFDTQANLVEKFAARIDEKHLDQMIKAKYASPQQATRKSC